MRSGAMPSTGRTGGRRSFATACGSTQGQRGHITPTLGSLNIEVTVTGQRGWVDEFNAIFMDIFNLGSGNILKKGNVW